ncbi:hypothetical protein LSTR_LSTR008704 [Laodelphax striatellus]|uniref:Uncharacterized protein n=1 Tax=Laodelphax striatellus TaxID=195883 RepID=A0A482WII7_LAOST|nr:hypothetical protein LSTR_LSTR008704 [Laodelphax striatellus]
MKMFTNYSNRILMSAIDDLSTILYIFHADGLDWCPFQIIFDEFEKVSQVKLGKMQLRKILNMASALGTITVNHRDKNQFRLKSTAVDYLQMVTPSYFQGFSM